MDFFGGSNFAVCFSHCFSGTLLLCEVLCDFPGGSDGKASAYNEGDPGSIPGSRRSPGEGNGNPLQYSCPPPPNKGAQIINSRDLLFSIVFIVNSM